MIIVTGFVWFSTTLIANETQAKESEKGKLVGEINKLKDLQTDLGYIVDRKAAIAELEAEAIDYNYILEQLAAATPQTLQITNFSLGKETGEIPVNGTAAKRADVVAFVENLTKSGAFSDIRLIQADAQTENVIFSLKMNLKNKAATQAERTEWKQS